MQIILLQDVDKLGLRGEVVEVARGYARNYLLPRRLAETATPAKVRELEKREAQRARHEARSSDQAREVAAKLGTLELRFDVKAGPTGVLFGSVTPTDIADEIWSTSKVRVDRRKIDLPDSIKRVGRYTIPIAIFEDVTAEVRTLVIPEGGELPPEETLAAMEAAHAAEEEAAAAAEAEAEAAHAVAEAEIEQAIAEEEVEEAEVEEAGGESPAEPLVAVEASAEDEVAATDDGTAADDQT